ncbi:MAG: HAD family hydrolase [Proteobacteria bacterium]|nr:HAD family hydrolase [Pseudomonadota bacterium]
MTLPSPDPVSADPGLWQQVLTALTARPDKPVPALFLDRDGVIVAEVNYLHRIDDIEILPEAAEIIARCNRTGIPVVLVTNQSGIGRGYYDWAQFAAVQDEIRRRLAESGASIDMVLACAYHDAGKPPYDVAAHAWRKPRPGMLQAAARALNLDLRRSWIVGDSASDLEAGKIAGLAGGIHVLTGHGNRDRKPAMALADAEFEIIPEPGIGGALNILARLGA